MTNSLHLDYHSSEVGRTARQNELVRWKVGLFHLNLNIAHFSGQPHLVENVPEL
jgi:hypothetical protein